MIKLSKKEWVAVFVAIAFITFMFFGNVVSGLFAKFNNLENSNTNRMGINLENNNGILTQDIVVGLGESVEPGKRIAVNYVLRLADGTLIQDSKIVGGGEPFVFTFGVDRLIVGWEMGIQGMKVGGKRIITVPPELGYGPQEVGPIPANSTLVFEIEAVSIE